ncbi:MAG: DUF493 domain-containing protein [Myxococcota bacterium]
MEPLTGKPVIEYPCAWEWRVIGSDPDQVKAAVAEVLAEREHTLRSANRSPKGRWLSMSLELEVQSEADRDAIHRALTGHRWIRLAL